MCDKIVEFFEYFEITNVLIVQLKYLGLGVDTTHL